MIAPGGTALVLTPLSPHGGVCPPLVASGGNEVAVTLDPGNGGARVEVDGQIEASSTGSSPSPSRCGSSPTSRRSSRSARRSR